MVPTMVDHVELLDWEAGSHDDFTKFICIDLSKTHGTMLKKMVGRCGREKSRPMDRDNTAMTAVMLPERGLNITDDLDNKAPRHRENEAIE